MGFVRLVFSAISMVGGLFVLVYVVCFFYCLRVVGFCKDIMKYVHNTVMPRSKVSTFLAYFVMGFALVNTVCSIVFESDQIGAFYEAPVCYEIREAAVNYCGKDVFCLARIRKDTSSENIYYYIDALYFPHNLYFYNDDCEIDIDDEVHSFSLSAQAFDCDLDVTLYRKADEASYIALENTVIHQYGDFCFIPSSDVFHKTNCRYVKNAQSLIFATDAYEASGFFDLRPCKVCCDDSIW